MKMCKLLYLLCFMALVYGAMARGNGGRGGHSSQGHGGHGQSASSGSGEDKKLNVILMYGDDMGINDLGYVNDEVKTPIIDALSSDGGARLGNSYVQPVCTPTRVAAMTGKYPGKVQLGHHVIFPTQPLCIPLNIKILPQYMKDSGYTTYMVGKWHLGFCQAACLPLNRGFDHFYGYLQGEQEYAEHTSGGLATTDGYDWREGEEVDWSADGTHNMFLINDRAVKWISEHDIADPFFMYLAWSAPHSPLTPIASYATQYLANPDLTTDRANYLGLVSMLDEGIGNVTQALKDNDLYDNTIIIFSSDNGGTSPSASTGHYRGVKGTSWEGGVRALGFVHGIMIEQAGVPRNGLIHATDWLPTIMGLIGNTDFDADIDGVDQSAMILRNEASKRNEILLVMDMMPNHLMGQMAVRVGDFKMIWGGYGLSDGYIEDSNVINFYKDPVIRAEAGFNEPWSGPGNPFAATGDDYDELVAILGLWAFQADDIDSGKCLLFNVVDDPYEKTNLSEDPAYADTVQQLKEYALEQVEGYSEMPAECNTNRASGIPTNFNETWSTGWCDDLSLLN